MRALDPPAVPLAQLRAVANAFLSVRPKIVAPAALLLFATLAFSPVPRAQVAAVGAGITLLLGFFVWEALAARRRPFDEQHLSRSLRITLLMLGVACAATGGIRSPVVPLLFAPAVVAFSAFGRTRRSTIVLVLFGVITAALTAMPRGVPFAPIPWPWDVPIAAVATLASAVLLRAGVGGLSDAYGRAAGDLDVAREAVLTGATARARALESIGAKVAHEIKNPLSAVRGLLELVSSNVEGRDVKRLEVALSEVARIETILADYLSYSRPLSELEPRPVDLRALAEEVGSIVEARAQRAGVTFEVRGAATVEADPSRIKEALLNLVGNALEASPDGGAITLELAADAEGATLNVRDRGRGLSASQLALLGTPGFTTREGGTGLGVVLARAAIAQHGGALTFESEPGRGTVAMIRLPAKVIR